jgi:Helix-turn-helix.
LPCILLISLLIKSISDLLRHSKNLSQAEISDRLKVSQPAYHLWETDQAKPTTENLLKISEIYNLDLYTLPETQDQNIINNSTFQDSSSVQQQYYPTINNMVPPELLESVIKNQEQITLQQQQITQLIEKQAYRGSFEEINQGFYITFCTTL